MKYFFLTLLVVGWGVCSLAQDIEKAKDLLKDKKLSEAKTLIDKIVANPKKAKDADVWYTRSKIYLEIANDSLLKSTVPDAREQAFEALKTYVDIDTKNTNGSDGGMQLIMLQLEQFKPAMDLYYSYYTAAATFYNSNNFSDAYTNFKKCLEVGDYLIEKKWVPMVFDTVVVLYTGIAAEKSNNKDTAAYYYSLLADKKIPGEAMREVYKWLIEYYLHKPDTASTAKYISIGAELYPDDNYWLSTELDMASSGSDKQSLYKKYEEMIAKFPSNYLYPYNYGVELYKTVSVLDSSQPRPANASETLSRVRELVKKSLELNPEYYQANLFLGQIAYNEGVELTNQLRMIKPAPGVSLAPDQQKRKVELKAEATRKFDEAIPYFEKVDNMLSAQGKLKMEQKKNLKEVYDLLIRVYESRSDREKKALYEGKFNNVDKVH